jgi:hypothetical protein
MGVEHERDDPPRPSKHSMWETRLQHIKQIAEVSHSEQTEREHTAPDPRTVHSATTAE